MKDMIAKEIEEYAARHSTPEPEKLCRLAGETQRETSYPQMMIGHLEGTLLRLLVRIANAKRVLEIGTFTGYSALAMAEALPEDGELITLDRDEKTTALAQRHWSSHPHGSKIRLVLGEALESLQKLEGPFDLVFIDADKTNYWNYWEACLPKVRRGGVIAVDNVLWSGRVLKPVSEDDRAIAEFNRRAARDERVECVMLTVRDGLTIAVKN